MIRNRYTLSEEMMKELYLFISEDYFKKFRKRIIIFLIICIVAMAIVPIVGLKGILMGMAGALALVAIFTPALRLAKVKTDVGAMAGEYTKMYGGFPEQDIRIHEGTLTVYINGEKKSSHRMKDVISVQKNDRMLVLAFPDNDILPLMNDGYVKGTYEDMLALVEHRLPVDSKK